MTVIQCGDITIWLVNFICKDNNNNNIVATFHLSAQEGKASRSCEFKVSPVCRESFRTTKAIQRMPVSKKQKKAQKLSELVLNNHDALDNINTNKKTGNRHYVAI